jgi:hypothetical protein
LETKQPLAPATTKKSNTRQIFAAPKQEEVIQIQPRQAGVEISGTGDDQVETRSSNGGAVVVRIGKRGCATVRHVLHLI